MNTQHRLLTPKDIKDSMRLSRLLDQLLDAIEQNNVDMTLQSLSWDSQIPQAIWLRLRYLHRNLDDAPNMETKDFYIVFAEIKMRFPTARIWEMEGGEVYFEM